MVDRYLPKSRDLKSQFVKYTIRLLEDTSMNDNSENVEDISSEEVLTDDTLNEEIQSEESELDIEQESDEAQSEDEENEIVEEELTPAAKKKLGAEIAKQRVKMRQKLEEEYRQKFESQYQQSVPPAPEGTIYDPQTGEHVDAESVTGQLLMREQKMLARQMEAQALMQDKKRESELLSLQDKVAEGFGVYDNFQDAVQTFSDNGTEEMAEALMGVDDPAEIIAHLGSKKGELHRIGQLSSAKQKREIYRIEERLKPRKKLVSKAPQPIENVNSNRNLATAAVDQSLEQRSSYWDNYFNKR